MSIEATETIGTIGPASKPSGHKVEVVPIQIEDIPGSDFVGLVRIYGFTCVTQKQQWQGTNMLAAYIPPDSTVPVSRSEFSFLAKDAKTDGRARIKAKKLRGVLSFGLLVPAPAGSVEGQDVSDLLQVEHYNPPEPGSNNRGGLFMSGEVAKAPDVYTVKYDLEAGRRYAERVMTPGEFVVCSEKLHGANSRYVYSNGQMYCGSRTEWKKEFPTYDHVTVESLIATGKVDEIRAREIVAKLHDGPKARNMWWQALDATPALRSFCEAHPDTVVYGEIFGAVQDLNYGHEKGKVSFAAFDIMENGQWLDFEVAFGMATAAGVPWVPIIEDGIRFDFDAICQLAEGKTLIPGADHVREGIVVVPVKERYDPTVGRVKLKFVSAGYLERSK